MIIETKYNIGDEVWFQRIVSGEIVSDKIRGVVFVASASTVEIWYRLEGYMDLDEYELFPTKGELLKSL